MTLNWDYVVTDGDNYPDSGMGTSGEFAYTGSGLHYVQLDLGAVYSVTQVTVWHYVGNPARTYHHTKTQVSADGLSWYTAFDSAVSGEYVETAAGKTHTFAVRPVRYIRDYANGSTANSGNHWVEIKVPDDETTVRIGNYAVGKPTYEERTVQAVEVPDPGFEDNYGWIQVKPNEFPGTSFEHRTWGVATPHEGSYANATSNLAYGYLQSDAIQINPNSIYDLYAYVRGEIDPDDSFGYWIVRAYYYNGSTPLSYTDVASGPAGSLNTTWQWEGMRITTPANASGLRVQLITYMISGWVAFDDVELIRVINGVRTAPNLITNPGFEGTNFWTEFRDNAYPGTSFYRGTWGTGAPHGDSYAYAISNHTYGYLYSDLISVNPGEIYDLYAYVRGEIDVHDSQGAWLIRARIYQSGGGTTNIDVNIGGAGSLTTTWQRLGGRFTVPSGATGMDIMLYNYMNTGWVAYDDVELIRVINGVRTAPNLVTNPGFELSGGWTGTASAYFPGTSFYRNGSGSTAPHSGTTAYAISNHAYGTWQSDAIPVNPGTPYDLYAFVRGELDATGSEGKWILRAHFYDSNGGYIYNPKDVDSGQPGGLSTTWQFVGGRFTTPANTASLRLQLINYMNSGWLALET